MSRLLSSLCGRNRGTMNEKVKKATNRVKYKEVPLRGLTMRCVVSWLAAPIHGSWKANLRICFFELNWDGVLLCWAAVSKEENKVSYLLCT